MGRPCSSGHAPRRELDLFHMTPDREQLTSGAAPSLMYRTFRHKNKTRLSTPVTEPALRPPEQMAHRCSAPRLIQRRQIGPPTDTVPGQTPFSVRRTRGASTICQRIVTATRFTVPTPRLTGRRAARPHIGRHFSARRSTAQHAHAARAASERAAGSVFRPSCSVTRRWEITRQRRLSSVVGRHFNVVCEPARPSLTRYTSSRGGPLHNTNAGVLGYGLAIGADIENGASSAAVSSSNLRQG